jgi:hypothetical protein
LIQRLKVCFVWPRQAELAAVEGDARLSRAQIGKIVGLQADAIREASDAYADEMSLLDTSGAGSGGTLFLI